MDKFYKIKGPGTVEDLKVKKVSRSKKHSDRVEDSDVLGPWAEAIL